MLVLVLLVVVKKKCIQRTGGRGRGRVCVCGDDGVEEFLFNIYVNRP